MARHSCAEALPAVSVKALASSIRLTRSVKVKETTTDEEADGREELDQTAGKRKGMCCTEGRPAQRLKRVFNRAAQVGPPRY